MSALDPAVLAERTAAVQRHLRRVGDRLPEDPAALLPMTDATDAVVLHLWQATQIVIDLAVSACVALGLGAPATYADAFRKLGEEGVIDDELAARLARAAGFRNVVVHAYADLDLRRVHQAATQGPDDLLAFLAGLRERLADPDN
jgi:uncharacterized protein YutE (UPF0331/DUF86 family)